jgi:hypothetical protein
LTNSGKNNKQDSRSFFLLFHSDDFADFNDEYKDNTTESKNWVPVTALPIAQVLLQVNKQTNFIPSFENVVHDDIIKSCYKIKQEFLTELWGNIEDNTNQSYPLEYFWWRTWIGVYRTIAYCSELLSKYSVNEIILYDRDSYVVEGGLLINHKSYTSLIRNFFESKGIHVKCIEKYKPSSKPKTIYYDDKSEWKRNLLHFLRFVLWKTMTFNKKHYGYLLIKPGKESAINYQRRFLYTSDKSCPQAYHGAKFPFLHSFSDLFSLWLVKKKTFNEQSNIKYHIPNYIVTISGFTFDFSQYFKETIIQYFKDVTWMENYINAYWDTCFKSQQPMLINFRISPVHLDSHFLIKKIKSVGGKLATHQHGGNFSYTESFFWRTIQDYTCSDYFLSFGKSDVNDLELFRSYSGCIKNYEVGSLAIAKPRKNRDKVKGLLKSKGLYVPGDIRDFTPYPIDKACEINTVKGIINIIGAFKDVKYIIKGLKGHMFHEELNRYIKRKLFKNVSYSSISLKRAIEERPRFIILNNSSTPLIEILASYAGPVFLLSSQPPWVKKEAIQLLKRRVSISDNCEQLGLQLREYFDKGVIKDVDLMDNSFMDRYCKPFNFSIYERFLNQAMKKQ